MHYLPKDIDIANYAQICRTANHSVTPSVWRKRFIENFDIAETAKDQDLTAEKLHTKYKFRRMFTSREIFFDTVRNKRFLPMIETDNELNQTWCLKILRELILGKVNLAPQGDLY